jgi:hypothetical protein
LERGGRAEASRVCEGQGPPSRPPAEVAIALARDLIAVVGGLGVASLGRQGLELKGLCSPQRLQHGIKPLPRPLQQVAEVRDGDPSRGRRQAVGGRPELRSQALRVEEPGQLLVLVEPIA